MSMRARTRSERALGCLILLASWALLSGCTMAREAGKSAAGGAFDAARQWWATEGQKAAEEKATLLAERMVTAGREKIDEKIQAYRDDLGKKVDAGTASATETAMYWALGGSGGVGGALALLFGRKKPGAVIPPA